MCGIAGTFNLKGRPADAEILHRMIGAIRHRGPDGTGVEADGPLGLAHARLSIIDLAGGRQPLSNEDGSVWITFNGEIYNYLELRETLLLQGHEFSTRSDTEVIVHLYEEYGEDCVRELNGQWAFAIWDGRKRKLFLSRDRLGVRPLFYTVSNGVFIFASEIKSIFTHPDVSRQLDPEALDEVFTFWFTLPPRTPFKGIQELPPGNSLTLADGAITVRPHWEPRYESSSASPDEIRMSEANTVERLRELLSDATRIRLRSDVPVGAYLSGGLDSTLTTALIRRQSDTHLRTFSVSFTDEDFDEREYQREAVRFLDTDHEEIRCTGEDIARVFPDVIWHAEKPVLRTAPAPLYLLSGLVRRRGYKVVLTGEGADEVFGGYDIFKETKIRRFWRAQPDSRLRPLLLRRLYPYLPRIQSQSTAYLKAFFNPGLEQSAPGPFFSHQPRWEMTSSVKLFLSPAVRAGINSNNALAMLERRLPADYRRWNWLEQAQYLETAYLLPGYILSSQGDRVVMAHSVEARFPFLDYRVVEFASRLPASLKLKVLNEKYLLKQCADGLIPPSIRARYKQPYRAPDGKCFFNPRHDYVEELLSAERLRRDGIFQPEAVRRLVNKFQQGRAAGAKDNMALVGILSTQILVDRFVNHFSTGAAGQEDA